MSKAPEIIQEPQKARGTIGIIGIEPLEVAALNKEIVRQANLLGLKTDQEIPEVIAIGFRAHHSNPNFLRQATELCFDFGCDFIALSQIISKTSLIKNTIKDNFEGKLEIFTTDDPSNIASYAKNIVENALKIERPRRPNLLCKGELLQFNLEEDRKETKKRVLNRMLYDGGYPFLANNHELYTFILGGAGPAASAELSEKCAKRGNSFIYVGANSAPGKHLFEIGEGPSYIPHYQNAIHFAHIISTAPPEANVAVGEPNSIVIPCNTAHRRLTEFCKFTCDEKEIDMIKKVFDIRSSLFTQFPNDKDFILFGTSTTVGVVDSDPNYIGTYEMFRRDYFDDHSKISYIAPFIKPEKAVQDNIMNAIFKIKAGEFPEAKTLLLKAISDARRDCEDDKRARGDYKRARGDYKRDLGDYIILGCTELPLLFTTQELYELRLIDPADSLTDMINSSITKSSAEKFKTYSVSRATFPRSNSGAGISPTTTPPPPITTPPPPSTDKTSSGVEGQNSVISNCDSAMGKSPPPTTAPIKSEALLGGKTRTSINHNI